MRVTRDLPRAGRDKQTRMLPPELNRVCMDEGDSYGVHPKICNLEMVPNLRRSNSGFCKSKRKAHFATGNNEKASLDCAKVRGG